MSNDRELADRVRKRTRPWDAAELLENADDIVAYVEAALEDGDQQVIAVALDDIARSRGLTELASQCGLSRDSLNRAISSEDYAEIIEVFSVLVAEIVHRLPRLDCGDSVERVDGERALWNEVDEVKYPNVWVRWRESTSYSSEQASKHL